MAWGNKIVNFKNILPFSDIDQGVGLRKKKQSKKENKAKKTNNK